MKILYFDCFAGISGDMTLGALLDLGIEPDWFLDELGKLDLEGYKVDIRKVMKNGIAALDVNVIVHDCGDVHFHSHDGDEKHCEHSHGSHSETDHHHEDEGHSHDHDGHSHHHSDHSHHHSGHSHSHQGLQRNYSQIRELIQNSRITENAKNIAIKIFERLARAEGKIHNVPHEEVHFHEVGAVDSIVDIVGAAICIDYLKPDRIISSPVHVGGGMTKSQHGIIPVPAPATLELLKGIPVYSKGFQGELVTPTGAAILASLCSEFTEYPSMILQEVGYGTGKKTFEFPNCLRACLGESIKK